MAVTDTPIEPQQQNTQVDDTPIQQPKQQQTSPDFNKYLAVQSAFIDSYLTGSNAYENYKYYSQDPNKEQTAKQLSHKKAEEDGKNVLQNFIESPGNNPDEIKQNADYVKIAQHQINKQGSDVDQQYAEALSGPNVDLQKIRDEAAKSKMAKWAMQWQGDVTTGDKVMDFAKSLIPFHQTYEGYKLSGSLINQGEQIKKAIAAFQLKSPEEQESLLKPLHKELVDKVGKEQAAQIISKFVEPGGAEKFNQYSNIGEAVDVGLSAPAVGAFIHSMKAFKDGYNVVKSLQAVGNHEGAVNAAVSSLVDPKVAQAANVDDLTRVSNALPYDVSVEDIGHQGGLSPEVLDRLDKFMGKADKTAQDIITGNGFLKEGILNTKERAAKEADAIKQFQADKASNLQIIGRDENTTTFQYDSLDENGNTVQQQSILDLTLNDVGSWEESTLGKIRAWAGSSTTFGKGALRADVNTAQRVDYLRARINTELNKLTKEAIKPIGSTLNPRTRGRLAKINHALTEGDEFKNEDGTRGKVFTPDELKSKYGLDENESDTYYRMNRLYNNLFNIRNHEKRQEMIALGFKKVNFDQNGESSFGKVLDNAGAAQHSLNSRNANYVYDVANDRLINVKKAGTGFLSDEYTNGNRIVRLQEPYDVGGDRGKVFYTLSHESDIEQLPDTVLYRKKGYVPRIYENGSYFVKQIKNQIVDGDKTIPYTQALRFFDNEPEAKAYLETLVHDEVSKASDELAQQTAEYKKAYQKYETGMDRYNKGLRKTKPKEPKAPKIDAKLADVEKAAREKYKVFADREEQQLGKNGDVGHGSGGLYTGARADEALLYGLNGSKAKRVNAFEAITRNNSNVARYASINQWRLGMEQRWINSAKKIFEDKGVDLKVDKFTRLEDVGGSTKEVKFLNKMYDQIRDWQNFPTQEEQIYNTVVQDLYNLSKSGEFSDTAWKKWLGKGSSKLLGSFRNKDPIANARAATFHALLGWFNPSQFWVQAQGFSNAFALGFGKYFSRVSMNTLGLTTLWGGEMSDARIALAAKASHNSFDEMKALYNLWHKTGYEDSVLQTADHAAAAKGYGMAMDVLKRASNTGLIFYRHGELFNRRMSFLTAIERYKEKQGLKSIVGISDQEFKSIIDDTNNILMNMSRANRASWQRGALSLPTQFLQVTTKFMETALGLNHNFTGIERAKLITAQLALYGTAGIPLVGLGEKFAAEYLGMSQTDIENNPKTVAAINDGFWGVLTNWAIGQDFEVSSRGSLLNGVSQFINNWFVEDSSTASRMLGAFGTTGTRFWNSFTKRIAPFTLGGFKDFDLTDALEVVPGAVADSVSSWNNFEKASFMNGLKETEDRKGRITSRENYDWRSVMMQAIGFQPSVTQDNWDLKTRTDADNAKEKQVVSLILNKMNDWAAAHPDGDYDPKEFKKYQDIIGLYYNSLSPDQQKRAQQAVWKAATGQDMHSQYVNKYIKDMKNNTASDLESWKAALLGDKVIRLGVKMGDNK